MTRMVKLAVVALGAALVSMFVAVGPASAAQYDGTDPAATGCDNSAITAYATNIRNPKNVIVGQIELRYSRNCRTAWARVTKNSHAVRCVVGDVGCASATIHRNQDKKEYRCSTKTGGNSCYTKQVNDDHVTSYAHGDVDLGTSWPGANTKSY